MSKDPRAKLDLLRAQLLSAFLEGDLTDLRVWEDSWTQPAKEIQTLLDQNTMILQACAQCNEAFKPKGPQALYCSQTCAQKALHERRMDSGYYERRRKK